MTEEVKEFIDRMLKQYDFSRDLCGLCRINTKCEKYCEGKLFNPKWCGSPDCINRDKECYHCQNALPHFRNFYEWYKPICPLFNDCIHDPAYIQKIDPQYYKELYGELIPKEAFEKYCAHHLENNDCPYYDDEDK